MNILLSNPVIIILSIFAIIAIVASRFVTYKYADSILSVLCFLFVAASITYALLLGAELTEILVYVLFFALLGALVFIPVPSRASTENNTKENLRDKRHNDDPNGEEILEKIDGEKENEL